MTEYRQALSLSLFYKFYMTVLGRITASSLPQSEVNITRPISYHATKSSQGFQDVPLGQSKKDSIGRPIPHLSATKQASGVAIYVDDMPQYANELYCAIVWSARAHANVVEVNAEEATKIPGVWGFIGSGDVKEGESNMLPLFGFSDEVIFPTEVTCRGQILGLILANDQQTAKNAARRVTVTYENLPSILSIQEAIENKTLYEFNREIKVGDVSRGFDYSDHVITGEIHIGGQEHFYMETNSVLVVPKEDGEMEVFNSTQNAHITQMQIAQVTGIPSNKIVVRVKRIGGSYGGKDTRSIPLACAVALAAKRSCRPVRAMLDRYEDMSSTGTRHPFLGKYKIGCMNNGKIISAYVELYSNGGNTLDLSLSVLERALCHVDNCYKIPNWHVIGKICKTNIPSSTAFRGFGGPQAMFVMEDIIVKVAQVCGLDPTEVRHLNLYHDGDHTHFRQALVDCHIQKCWEELIEKADVQQRRIAIDKFNSESRWIKHGLAIVPTKFGIAFDRGHLNQGGALLHVYADGQVLLTHGGTEMGQGLHTKMVQVCARALAIPPSKIHISEMATNTVPNASTTAASVSTDLYGKAVQNACETIRTRLSPYVDANPKATWEEWVKSAHMDHVNLSAQGFYKAQGQSLCRSRHIFQCTHVHNM
jgi:xanthine dehydrogenase/oxidase